MIANDLDFVLTTSTRTDDRVRILKHGDTFAVFDRYGDLHSLAASESGLYHGDTRFLSKCELRVAGQRPLLLGSTIRAADGLLIVDVTTPDLPLDRGSLPRGALHISRRKFLWAGACFERLDLANYGGVPIRTRLTLHLDADFADLFEVRGATRVARGQMLPPEISMNRLTLAYRGRDDIVRRTTVRCDPPPAQMSPSRLAVPVALDPGETLTLDLEITCEIGGPSHDASLGFDDAFEGAGAELRGQCDRHGAVTTDNDGFNEWIARAASDLAMLSTELADGAFPYAGVPWCSAPYGRDALMTAFALLWIAPDVAQGVLRHLAATQAADRDAGGDAQPGRILYESRQGEMAALGEVPFARDYGSVDTTPLFVMLAGAYYRRTGDRAFAEELWPHIDRALAWIDRDGDVDGDGFVEYTRDGAQGRVNQGWREASDAIFDEHGLVPSGALALSEVQAYVYAARRAASGVAAALGQDDRATSLEGQAGALRRQFERSFWCADLGTYALALDGEKRPCRVRSSSAGHVLWSGIASPDRARRVARGFATAELYSGWGVRTVAAGEPRFNPMARYNGSVWPHDSAVAAMGCARYGERELAMRVLSDLFDAARVLDLRRLPERFCGFARRPGEGPTMDSVACAPRACAAAAVFMLLQAVLGLEVDGVTHRVTLAQPDLPSWLGELRLDRLAIGDARLDVRCVRHAGQTIVTVHQRRGEVTVAQVM